MTTLPSPSLPNKNKRLFAMLALAAIAWLISYNIIHPLADWLAYGLLSLPQDSHLGESLAFFFYDVPKILLLLSGMIFLISLLQTFIDTQKVRLMVEKRGEGIGNFMQRFSARSPHSALVHLFRSLSDSCRRASRWESPSHFSSHPL